MLVVVVKFRSGEPLQLGFSQYNNVRRPFTLELFSNFQNLQGRAMKGLQFLLKQLFQILFII